MIQALSIGQGRKDVKQGKEKVKKFKLKQKRKRIYLQVYGIKLLLERLLKQKNYLIINMLVLKMITMYT